MGGAILQTRRFRSGPIDIEIMRTAILLSLHNSRHLPAGADPLPVGVPSDVGVLNAEGIAELFARQDHVHNHPAGLGVDLHHPQLHAPDHLVGAGDPLAVGVPVDIGVANAEGAATNLARRDHVHNHPAALGFSLHHDHYARTIWDSLEMLDAGANILTAQQIYFAPLEIPFTVTVDRIGFCIDTANTANCKVALYYDNGDTPTGGALIVGSISTALAGDNRKQEVTIADTQLTPALYWLAYLSLAGTQPTLQVHHWPFAQTGGTLLVQSQNIVSDDLPDPAPAVGGDNVVPLMYVRVKSIP